MVRRTTADVVIVGGGVIGCALAVELAARGLEVTVVERGQPGEEASGAAAGMLTPQADGTAPSPFFDLALESRNLYPEWARDLYEETNLDVGYRRTGLLRCELGESGDERILASFLWQKKAGLPLERVLPETLAGELDGRLSPEVRGALFFPEEAMVDPRLLVRALWILAERRGVQFLTGTAALRFRVEEGVCRGVETEAGPIEAQNVVDAAGAWAPFDPTAPVTIPVKPVRGQIVSLAIRGKPLPVIVSSDEAYLAPRPDGTVLIGSTVEFVGYEKAVTGEAVARLLSAAFRLVPSLGAARFVAAWSGLRPGTPDGLPILGPCETPGLWFATGHFRNGVLLAPLTARLLAQLLTGSSVRDLSPFSIERFEPVRRAK